MTEISFATEGVREKIESRGLTLANCAEVLENNPYEIRSGTDRWGNPKYAAYGETCGGTHALVVYVEEGPEMVKILSARRGLSKAEARKARTRRRR